jgi:AraC-like DNA-binding protein
MGPATFSSRSAREAEAVVARFFEPHSLSFESWREIDFRFTHLNLNQSTSLSRLRYGAPVVIETSRFDTALMVSMPLSGCNQLDVAEERLELTPDNYSVLAPGGALRQQRAADCEMLILRIGTNRIHDYVTAHLGFTPRMPLTFEQQLQHAPAISQRLRRLASLILEDTPGEGSAQSIYAHYEQALIATVLFEHPNSYTALICAARGGAVARYVRRAEEFIRTNPSLDITIESLAREQGVSIRTLQLAFKRFRGCSPMQAVKSIRLELANKELVSSPPDERTVTEIAFKYGFNHLSGFARDYHARFGELPSESLRRNQ